MNIRRKQILGIKFLVFLFMFCSINLYYRSFVLKTYAEEVFINPLEYIYKSAKLKTESKNYEGAIRNYSKIIELSPYDLKAYLLRAKVYERINNYDLAYSDYSFLLDLKNILLAKNVEYTEIAYLKMSFILQRKIYLISDFIPNLANYGINKNRLASEQSKISKIRRLNNERRLMFKKLLKFYSNLIELYESPSHENLISKKQLVSMINSKEYCVKYKIQNSQCVGGYQSIDLDPVFGRWVFNKDNKDFSTKISIINALKNDVVMWRDGLAKYNRYYKFPHN